MSVSLGLVSTNRMPLPVVLTSLIWQNIVATPRIEITASICFDYDRLVTIYINSGQIVAPDSL